MSPAKVTLSPKELELVTNTDWILTKNAIIQKVSELFGDLSEVYKAAFYEQSVLTIVGLKTASPKISKGEKYHGLPWVMLDYPRHFTKKDVFGIRSFFWWGHYCSITLQLQGSFQQQSIPALQNYFRLVNADGSIYKDWFISISEDPWNHDVEKNNYEPVSENTLLSLPQLPFIKLTKKIPLQEWDRLAVFFEQNFKEIITMLST